VLPHTILSALGIVLGIPTEFASLDQQGRFTDRFFAEGSKTQLPRPLLGIMFEF
jgi:hypothetical protein